MLFTNKYVVVVLKLISILNLNMVTCYMMMCV
jgi:hypothetical protein